MPPCWRSSIAPILCQKEQSYLFGNAQTLSVNGVRVDVSDCAKQSLPKHVKKVAKMRLFTFIEAHMQEILNEWDEFAKTIFTEGQKRYLLRDHAHEILLELMADMKTTQSAQAQVDKSKGVTSPFHPSDNAASVHGIMRNNEGFTVSELAAEFRSLRASILRLWLPKIDAMSKEVVTDIVRFNEAIDEALADSITTHAC